MSEDLKIIPPQTVQTQVAKFKEIIVQNMEKYDTDKIELEVEEIKRFFRFQNEHEDTKFWLPFRFKTEMRAQGIRVQKRRGYTTAFVYLTG